MRKIVRFTQSCSPYLAGELAGFPEHEAAILVEQRRLAVYVDEVPVEKTEPLPEQVNPLNTQNLSHLNPELVTQPKAAESDDEDDEGVEAENEMDEDTSDDEDESGDDDESGGDDEQSDESKKSDGKTGRAKRTKRKRARAK